MELEKDKIYPYEEGYEAGYSDAASGATHKRGNGHPVDKYEQGYQDGFQEGTKGIHKNSAEGVRLFFKQIEDDNSSCDFFTEMARQ